jgi:anaerobic selenocysteine-containing dehydrogenase
MQLTPLPQLTLPTAQDFGRDKGIAIALITGRSYAQHNTVVYRIADKYRGMPHRQCILMNAEDVRKGGLCDRQRISVQGQAGQLDNIEIICGAVRRGAALMFYPEANILMTGLTDPKSHTPAYKRVPVLVFAYED